MDQSGYISYNTFNIEGDWKRLGNEMHSAGTEPSRMEWRAPLSRSTLTFKTSPDSGIIIVAWDGVEWTYDLYSALPAELEINNEHDAWLISFTMQRFLTAMILGLIFLAIYAAMRKVILGDDHELKKDQQTAGASMEHEPAPFMITFFNKYPVRIKRDNLFFLLLGLVGIFLILYLTRGFGLWLISDSAFYLSAGRTWAAARGYISLNTDTYDWWPPLFPNVLGLIEWLKFSDPLMTYRYLNALLFGVTVVSSGFYVKILFPRRRILRFVVPMLALLSASLVTTALFLLSEAIFIPLVLLFITFLFQYLKYKNFTSFILATLCAMLSALTRYAGVIIIFVGCSAILLDNQSRFKRRFQDSFLFGLASSLPLGLWLLRNIDLTGTLTGIRPPSRTSWIENLGGSLKVLLNWYVPFDLPPWLIGLIAAAILIFIAVRVARHRQHIKTIRFSLPVFVSLIFILIYAAWLIIALSIVFNAASWSRLLSPIYIPLTVLILVLLSCALERIKNKPIKYSVVSISVIFFMLSPVSNLSALMKSSHRQNVEQLSIHYDEGNSLLSYLNAYGLDEDLDIYSNCPKCLFIFADIQPTNDFLDESQYLSILAENDHFYFEWQEPFYIIWFTDVGPIYDEYRKAYYPLPDISVLEGREVELDVIFESRDGGIYRVEG